MEGSGMTETETGNKTEREIVREQLEELEGLFAICLADQDFPGIEVNHKFYRAIHVLHLLERRVEAHRKGWMARADKKARELGY
jgi:hypothetical protein